MAQPVFEEHPLKEYLRESGELYTSIPGISAELEQEIDLNYGIDDEVATPDNDSDSDWCSPIILEILKLLETVASLAKPQTRTSPFVERFKYNVISSSLLELSLPSPNPQRTRRSLRIPGNLQHSRASSMDLDHSSAFVSSTSEQSYGPLSISILLTAFFVGVGYPFLTFLSLVATSFLLYNVICMTETPKNDMSLSLNALDDLVAANDTWDSVVQDAMVYLEHEDNNPHSSAGPHSPSPIRVALNSCLQVTQTQCDNIRHLFSALTSPDNLSQLSEMYAPPSPVNSSTFSPEIPSRPLSINSLPLDSRFMVSPTTPQNKRSTWTGGSYSSLAYADSPTTSLFRRRERHRADVSNIFYTGASSAPDTPFTSSTISNSQEVNYGNYAGENEEDQFSPGTTHFGAAALSLQRRRRSGGLEAFRMPPASYFGSDLHSPRSARNGIFASSSKFTKSTPSRHPLSLSALNLLLQSTLAARRHACSHLLALRFDDEEDEGYWEDARSVMSLLSSAFIDGYSRLSEALMEVEQQKLRDQNPTPIPSSEVDPSDIPASTFTDTSLPDKWRRSATSISFAPMPSNISRFAAHVSTISSALDDARSHLEECISALKADAELTASASPSKRPRHARSGSGVLPTANDSGEESQALQAYERLRRELGLALRECERGRSSLVDALNPPMEPSDEDEELDDLPGLGHDASDDSDKADPSSPYDDEVEAAALAASGFQTAPTAETGNDGPLIDDATSQLLLGTSVQYLPLPGIEEVFEADTGAKATFKRERSKLSREERIKIAKAKRESGMGLSIGIPGEGEGDENIKHVGVEKWGPGGEVVQELKDVIWKVGERRRMRTSAATPCNDFAPAELLVNLPPSEPLQSATLGSL